MILFFFLLLNNVGIKQLMGSILWKSMGPINCLFTLILQNIYFSVFSRKKKFTPYRQTAYHWKSVAITAG